MSRYGDTILIDQNNPNGRYRILGISGNTGNVFGSTGATCGNITNDPNSQTCGEHLHFEIRTNNIVVNPYGWIGVDASGTPIPDPWTIQSGAVSYNLWATRPAVTTNQYGSGGAALDEPIINDTRMIIDSSSADFSTVGACWSGQTGNDSFNGEYYSAPANWLGVCKTKWVVTPDAFMPTEDYDIFVHIPDVPNASLSSVYNIKRKPVTEQAIVVQAVYPNPDHPDAWTYIGQYRSDIEYIELSAQSLLNDNGTNYNLADAIRFVPADPVNPPKDAIYTSFEIDGAAGDIFFSNEDILVYDTRDSTWLMYFDGSDVGLAAFNLDAFYLMGDNSILFSLDAPASLPGLGSVDDSDIIRFFPTSLGDTTSGTFGLYRSAASLGLNPIDPNQDVDVISFTPAGDILISTVGSFTTLTVFADADLIQVTGDPGVLSLYFDGSDVGLTTSTEGVNGAWIDGATGNIYLSTRGVFSVTGSAGDGVDIFVCTPGSIGNTTTCTFGSSAGLYWNGSAHGLQTRFNGSVIQSLDGFFNGDSINFVLCNTPPNCSFEQLDGDGFSNWIISEGLPSFDWHPSLDSHNGYYSAQGESLIADSTARYIASSSVPIDPDVRYRISYYSKFSGNFVNEPQFVVGYSGPNGEVYLIPFSTTWLRNEILFCYPEEATTTWFAVHLVGIYATGSIFIDDVSIEAVGQCPIN